jgi:hypothetical protein
MTLHKANAAVSDARRDPLAEHLARGRIDQAQFRAAREFQKHFALADKRQPVDLEQERSGAPSGLRISSFVMANTPVEFQFTSAGCLNYPCRTSRSSYFPAQNWMTLAFG